MSKSAARTSRHALRATLCEIERGLFYVTYPDIDVGADPGELSIYQVCASASDAKLQVEQNAHALGYDTIIWNDVNIAPLFPTDCLCGLGVSTTADASSPHV